MMIVIKIKMNKFPILVLCFSVLTACGGGGSDVGASTIQVTNPNLTVPLAAAIGNTVKTGYVNNFTITGWAGSAQTPLTGNGKVTQGAGVPVQLNGINTLRSTKILSASITKNGISTPISSTSSMYSDTNTFSTIADDLGTSYANYASYTLPATVKAGDTGVAWTARQFQSMSDTKLPGSGRLAATYIITADTTTSLLATFIVEHYGGICARVNTSTIPCIAFIPLDPTYTYTTKYAQAKITYRVGIDGNATLVTVESTSYFDTGAPAQVVEYHF